MPEKQSWHLAHLRYQDSQAFLHDESQVEYPIGRKKWHIDERKCDWNDQDVWLTLTSCVRDEFTCTDGTCIPLKYRWLDFFLFFCFYFSLLLSISSDLKADCADRSGNFF